MTLWLAAISYSAKVARPYRAVSDLIQRDECGPVSEHWKKLYFIFRRRLRPYFPGCRSCNVFRVALDACRRVFVDVDWYFGNALANASGPN